MSQSKIETFASETQDLARLNKWLFETILPFVKGRVLELSSGFGTMSSLLIEQGFTIQLNAPSENDRQYLKNKFGAEQQVKGVHKINLLQPHMELKYTGFQGKFSTVIALSDTAGYFFYDSSALKKAIRFLAPGGHFVTMGQCPVDLFPDLEEDFKLLKKYNGDIIQGSLPGCQPLITRFFYWKGLCFVTVGRKAEA